MSSSSSSASSSLSPAPPRNTKHDVQQELGRGHRVKKPNVRLSSDALDEISSLSDNLLPPTKRPRPTPRGRGRARRSSTSQGTAATAAAVRIWCHQCHQSRGGIATVACVSCMKSYCYACLSRRYNEEPAEEDHPTWTCPRCQNYCDCLKCIKARREFGTSAPSSLSVGVVSKPVGRTGLGVERRVTRARAAAKTTPRERSVTRTRTPSTPHVEEAVTPHSRLSVSVAPGQFDDALDAAPEGEDVDVDDEEVDDAETPATTFAEGPSTPGPASASGHIVPSSTPSIYLPPPHQMMVIPPTAVSPTELTSSSHSYAHGMMLHYNTYSPTIPRPALDEDEYGYGRMMGVGRKNTSATGYEASEVHPQAPIAGSLGLGLGLGVGWDSSFDSSFAADSSFGSDLLSPASYSASLESSSPQGGQVGMGMVDPAEIDTLSQFLVLDEGIFEDSVPLQV